MKTIWNTKFYDPQYVPEPLDPVDDIAHIVYAAMLEGVVGGNRLVEYTCFTKSEITKAVRKLADHGYVKKVMVNSRQTYVPLGMNGEF